MFRRVTNGPHPEAEMGRYLTEQGFANTPALLGEVVRVEPDGTRHALAIAQSFIRNQGDAWTWTLDLLMRGLSDLAGGDEAAAADAERHEDYDGIATLLGRRLGEMHAVLARPTDNPDFAPEAAGSDRTRAWAAQAEQQLAAAFNALGARQDWPEDAAQDLGHVMAIRDRLTATVRDLAAHGAGTRSPASTATCISGRCWWPTATCSSSISRANRPSRWSCAAPRTVRFAMSPGCCGRSTTRPRWWTAKAARARRICREARRTAFLEALSRAQPKPSWPVIALRQGRRIRLRSRPCSICSCSRRRLMRSSTRPPTGRPGSTCPCAAWPASPTRCCGRRLPL